MESVVVRRPTLDDASGVATLLAARDRADFGEDDPIGFTGDELRDWWAWTCPGSRRTRGSRSGATRSWAPEAPAGMTIRDDRPGDDDPELHAMHQDAFAGQWEFTAEPYATTRRSSHSAVTLSREGP
jgi:hypothetical protein